MDADRVIARLGRGYEDFNNGDFDAVLATLDPSIEVRERPDAPDPRHASGREEAIAAFRSLQEDFEDYRFVPREWHAEGDHLIVVARQSGRGRLSGLPVEGDIVHVWKIAGEDRVAGLHAFTTVEEARAAIARGEAG